MRFFFVSAKESYQSSDKHRYAVPFVLGSYKRSTGDEVSSFLSR